jgi:hypothetical protein
MKRKLLKGMVNNSTNINKINNHLPHSLTDHRKDQDIVFTYVLYVTYIL